MGRIELPLSDYETGALPLSYTGEIPGRRPGYPWMRSGRSRCACPHPHHEFQERGQIPFLEMLFGDEQRAVDRGRTGDLHVGNVALHHLSYNDWILRREGRS